MLLPRVITALVLLAILLPALFAASPTPFIALSLVLIAAAAWEWARLNQVRGAGAQRAALPVRPARHRQDRLRALDRRAPGRPAPGAARLRPHLHVGRRNRGEHRQGLPRGVFIASTNLVEGLDPAALRRFDLKARFDFLRADQAWDLLARQCAQLGLEAPPRGLRARVDRLSRLTPGDFATVVRQHRFRPISDAVDFVSRLEAECAMKEGAKRAIGLV